MCRPYCTTPDFRSLPTIPGGDPRFRSVHGIWMTEDEYRITGWHSRGTYETARGTKDHLWVAPLSGHIEWARRTHQEREQRIGAAQARREADDAYSAAVLADIERRQS